MEIEKVRIQNFRSIKDSNEVNIDDKVTSLIGKNDNGKTNFLKALEFFNKEYKYAKDDLCSYSEKEGIEAKDIEMITIWFGITDKDKIKLKELMGNIPKKKELKITKYFDNHYDFEIGDFKAEHLVAAPKKDMAEIISAIKSLVDALSEKIQPHIQRYPPFASSNPQYEQIIGAFLSTDFDDESNMNQTFSTLYSNLRSLPNQDAPIQEDIEIGIEQLEKLKEELTANDQENIKEEILGMIPKFIYFDSVDLLRDSITIGEYLADKPNYKTFTNLFELSNLNIDELREKQLYDRRFATDKASANITGRVNKSWKQEEVKVNIGCDGDHLFVYVEDKVGAHNPPSKRSDGFQWFLSFYINFMAGTKNEFKDTILLLDNPGVLLHPSGQKDLLNTLEKIAEKNQILFTTHSPFLIDREHLDRIRIVEKKEDRVGTTIKEKFHGSDFDALEPIRAAIGATIGDSLFGNKKNLIVEGYSDYLILEGLSYYFKRTKNEFIDTSKIAIIPVGGAKKTPYFALILWKEGYEFVILLDNDSEGRKVAAELKDKYPIEEDRIIKLDEIVSEEMKGIDFEIEDFIDPTFYNKAVNQTYGVRLNEKLGKEEIQLEDVNDLKSMQAKKYEDFFKKNRKLGRFDKIMVAKQIRNIVSDVSCTDEILGETTIKSFLSLFKAINGKLK
jgi:predicted ATP-dependent endonuclease of OLD family